MTTFEKILIDIFSYPRSLLRKFKPAGAIKPLMFKFFAPLDASLCLTLARASA
jgi:hypothetical protein